MIKIVTIIGARPQIIKAAALSRAIRLNFSSEIQEIIVHTGQHYDESMSGVFFEELEIPNPKYNLAVGSGTHANSTAAMMTGIEKILLEEKPNYIVLYGDTNSTVAGALAASKIHIDVVHIEAGLRSFNKQMPEEINRIMCDHVSSILFCPTQTAIKNLITEGFEITEEQEINIDSPAIYHCGDVMYDNSLFFSKKAKETIKILEKLNLKEGSFILATIHRDYNTDNGDRMKQLFTAILEIAEQHHETIVLPLHPRTNKMLEVQLGNELYQKVISERNIVIIEPVTFLEMIMLESSCSMVMTDSGGVQKEAFYFEKPCLILRTETEWVELLETQTAHLCDANTSDILESYHHFKSIPKLNYPPIFGDGNAAEFICEKLLFHI